MPTGKYSLRKTPISTAQYEVEIHYTNLISHPPEGDRGLIAPLRILSFDIECAGRKGIFPEAKHDPVIQIANIVTIHGEKQPMIRNVFTLNTCSPIAGVQVLDFNNESDLLREWKNFVQEAFIRSTSYLYVFPRSIQT